MFKQLFGIYEKALPRDWPIEKKLCTGKELGFDYFELSTDESEAFQARVRASREERAKIRQASWDNELPILTMCLSGTRNCPIGSKDPALREKGIQLTLDAIHFATDIGIRVVQAMAYDEYYGERDAETHALFIENLAALTEEAASNGVILALENVDIDTMNDLKKGIAICEEINSPYLKLYPDFANLLGAGWGNDGAAAQYRLAKKHIVASHVKDSVPGMFRDTPFDTGDVDFDLFFRTVLEEKINGPFTLEMWEQNYEDPVKAAGEALVFIKDIYERSLKNV